MGFGMGKHRGKGRGVRIDTVMLMAALMAVGTILPAGHGMAGEMAFPTREKLGQALFFDANLSANRSQACATCHNPDFAFTDPRETEAGKAVSLGDDGHSLGDRNAPSAAYALFSPSFHRLEDGNGAGGQFHDGRAMGLADQAGGPPLNPIEMGMKDVAAVEARLRENPDYVAAFTALFGETAMARPGALYRAMTEALAAYERTAEFAPFDSRYDRYLKGEETFTEQEELGRTLFFSTQFANCSLCHDIRGRDGRLERSTFSGYRYFNIGVPVNADVRKLNGLKPGHVDEGLALNPAMAGDAAARGKFKTPSLRNVAVTGPYMHNGVFKDLRTVVLFYNKYNSKKKSRQVDPETGQRWGPPEVADNIALKELETGPGLDDPRIDALVAFLKTLTDRRYEHLIDP